MKGEEAAVALSKEKSKVLFLEIERDAVTVCQ